MTTKLSFAQEYELRCEVADAIEEHGEAFEDYRANFWKDDQYALDTFEEAYAGKWASERAFAEDLCDQIGIAEGDTIESRYFDYDAWTRDLFMGDYWRSESGHVFNRNV